MRAAETATPATAPEPTPVRALGERTDEGWVRLEDVGSTYLDGAERWLYDVMLDTTDLSSTSDEMVLRARDWAERYHTDPSRSNVVRPFDLPVGARVLEVGAGCGAVTRYLGERCALVDAVEPVAARARVARARTRDLPNVEVFVGLTDHVPAVPTYDVVVVVGVLEYVGAGTADPAPYLAFLQGLADRLVPGGSLVLAIENKLGVKYFAGAPEDHTGRFFDSVESYPLGGIARTFSRRELEALMTRVGLEPETKVAFPDYKLTRAVLDVDALADGATKMARCVPRFPSFDWYVQRPRGIDEGLLWGSFVDAGLGADTGNSLVVAARKGPDGVRLWPATQGGRYYSVGRRSAHLTQTTIVVDADGARTERVRLRADAATDGLEHLGGGEPVLEAPDLVEVAATADDAALARLLEGWLELPRRDERGRTLLDLIPQNVVVGPDGRLTPIDQEWATDGWTEDDVVRRGVLRLGMDLAMRTPPERWGAAGTVGDVVVALGRLLGWDDPAWVEGALDVEAAIQDAVACPPYAGGADPTPDWWRAELRAQLDRPLATTPLGPRLAETAAVLSAEADRLRGELESALEQNRVLAQRATDLDAWIAGAVERERELRDVHERVVDAMENARSSAAEHDAERARLVQDAAEARAEAEGERSRRAAVEAEVVAAQERAREAEARTAAIVGSRTWRLRGRVAGVLGRVRRGER